MKNAGSYAAKIDYIPHLLTANSLWIIMDNKKTPKIKT